MDRELTRDPKSCRALPKQHEILGNYSENCTYDETKVHEAADKEFEVFEAIEDVCEAYSTFNGGAASVRRFAVSIANKGRVGSPGICLRNMPRERNIPKNVSRLPTGYGHGDYDFEKTYWSFSRRALMYARSSSLSLVVNQQSRNMRNACGSSVPFCFFREIWDHEEQGKRNDA